MFSIIKSSILSCLREKKELIFHVLFPVFLVLILGLTLSSVMDSSENYVYDTITVYYLDNGSSDTSSILEILKASATAMDIEYNEVSSLDEGKNKVRAGDGVFIYLNESNIDFYSNESETITSSSVFYALKGVIESYNATIQLYSVDSNLATELINNNSESYDDYFNNEKISDEKTPSSYGYYGVAEIGLMIFYFCSIVMDQISDERKKKIKDRYMLSGVSNVKYYLSKFIGCSIISYTEIIITYLILKFICKINYGTNEIIVPISLLAFVLIIEAFGVLFSIVFSKFNKISTVIESVIVPILCFLGGGYVAITDDGNSLFYVLTNISPLRHFNKAVLNSVYLDDNTYFYKWITLSCELTLVILVLVIILAKREEKVNG